jgi:hypothetical protein
MPQLKLWERYRVARHIFIAGNMPRRKGKLFSPDGFVKIMKIFAEKICTEVGTTLLVCSDS